MSTSPSWFDQEKFSRLVKKVGTTTRTSAVHPAPTLPASSPTAPSSTGPVKLPPTPAPEPTPAPAAAVPEPAPPEAPVVEPPARPQVTAIPKPTASQPLFSYKSASTAAAAAAPSPVAKAREPEETPAPEPSPVSPEAPSVAPEPPPVAPPRAARVFLIPPPAETAEPEPEPEPEPAPESEPPPPEKKPKFTFEIPKSELPAQSEPPMPPAQTSETAAEFHVSEPTHMVKKKSQANTSTLQRLPRIMPGGSKAPPEPTQTRTISALARRTTSLPGIKPLTAPLQPMEREEAPIRATETAAPAAQPPPLETVSRAPTVGIPAIATQTKSLPPPLSPAVTAPAETFETWDTPAPPPDDLASYKEQIAQLNRERDETQLEAATLRSQLAAAREQASAPAPGNEVAMLTGERDSARRDYAELRQQYETLKQEQHHLKADHDAALAAAATQSPDDAGKDDVIETLKQELKNLEAQVVRAREESSSAQRGLTLSQKALQETRDALREASEGKNALEGLKKERATLVQQNMLLQAQSDQVARELSALKAKMSR